MSECESWGCPKDSCLKQVRARRIRPELLFWNDLPKVLTLESVQIQVRQM